MENNLESYFAAIEAQLGDMPVARKTEFMDEMRAHLHAMVEANRADGHDAATAWLHSMREFGEPEKVGRALRKQWADSAQLESEGEPLSRRRKWRMFALPVAACCVFYALFTLARGYEASWQLPLIAALAFGCLAYGTASDVRGRGGWKPSTIVGCIGAFILLSNSIFNLSGHQSWGGEWRTWGMFAFTLLYVSLYHWLSKCERAHRPWQFGALYKTNPIAAEQMYRLSPLVGLAMGTAMSCIGLIAVGSQFFGLPVALISCAGVIGVSVVLGRWLLK